MKPFGMTTLTVMKNGKPFLTVKNYKMPMWILKEYRP